MHVERIKRLHKLFDDVIDLEPEARAAYLDSACGGDATLRSEIEQLVAAADPTIEEKHAISERRIDHARAGLERLLNQESRAPVAAGSSNGHGLHGKNAAAFGIPKHVGRYRLVRRIASGGMGSVYEATQDNPKRRVALKMVHAQRMSPALVSRLQRESDILGRLQHPGIAQVHDAGMIDLGGGDQPFFAMEYIDGVALTKHCEQANLDDRACLELLAAVCDAVQYAHDKGVIHRDLKPDNILVDRNGRPRILDFGIARITNDSTPDAATMTQQGQILGTVAYMAPEQMEGSGRITNRADVYALGAICFEMLAGRLPQEIAGLSPAAALHRLMQHDPVSLGEIDRRFRGDIETIVAKALQREPSRRYESAAVLGADIRRYLQHEPILAHPPSAVYHARRFVRRHKAVVAGAASVFVVLVAGIILTTRYAWKAEAASSRTAEALADLDKSNKKLRKTIVELEQVSGYQEAQLSGIRLDDLADQMHESLLEERKATMAQSGFTEAEIDAAIKQLDDALSGIALQAIARSTLEKGIFDHSLQSIDAEFADQPLVRAKLLLAIGKVMLDVGNQFAGRDAILESMRIRREHLGDDHVDTLRTIAAASEAIRSDSRDSEFKYAREAYFGLRETLGKTHHESLAAQLSYGSQACHRNLEGADKCLEEAFELSRQHLQSDDPLALKIQARWAFLLWQGGDRDEGERLTRDVIERARASDPCGAVVRNTLSLLAVRLSKAGRVDEAEGMLRSCLAECEELRGTTRGLGNLHQRLGNILLAQRRFEEAETHLQFAFQWDQDRAAFSKGNFVVQHNLGFAQWQLGKLEDAERNMRAANKQRAERNGYLNILNCGNLALVLAEQGKFEEADEVALRGLNQVLSAKRPNGWRALRMRRQYAEVLVMEKRFADAEEQLLEIARVQETPGFTKKRRDDQIADRLVKLYDAWHEAEPESGFDEKAGMWRAKRRH